MKLSVTPQEIKSITSLYSLPVILCIPLTLFQHVGLECEDPNIYIPKPTHAYKYKLLKVKAWQLKVFVEFRFFSRPTPEDSGSLDARLSSPARRVTGRYPY